MANRGGQPRKARAGTPLDPRRLFRRDHIVVLDTAPRRVVVEKLLNGIGQHKIELHVVAQEVRLRKTTSQVAYPHFPEGRRPHSACVSGSAADRMLLEWPLNHVLELDALGLAHLDQSSLITQTPQYGHQLQELVRCPTHDQLDRVRPVLQVTGCASAFSTNQPAS